MICKFNTSLKGNKFTNFTPLQESNNREYIHAGIRLRLPIVDKLKKWNSKNPSVNGDEKFIKLIMVDIFTTHMLAESSIDTLDKDKIRFARGSYPENEKNTDKIIAYNNNIFFHRYFRSTNEQQRCTSEPFQRHRQHVL